MIEKLARLREPATWIVLAMLWLRVLVSLVGVATADSPSLGFWYAGTTMLEPVGPLLLTLLVGSCALWRPTGGARTLALLATVTVAGLAVFGLLSSLGVLFVRYAVTSQTVAHWTEVGVLGVLVWGLATVVGQLSASRSPALPGGYGRPSSQPQGGGPWGGQESGSWGGPPLRGGPQSGDAAFPQHPGQHPGQPPSWRPDEAAGQSWTTAGDAASGAAGSATGQPWDGPSGWGSAAAPQGSAGAADWGRPSEEPAGPREGGREAGAPGPGPAHPGSSRPAAGGPERSGNEPDAGPGWWDSSGR